MESRDHERCPACETHHIRGEMIHLHADGYFCEDCVLDCLRPWHVAHLDIDELGSVIALAGIDPDPMDFDTRRMVVRAEVL